MLTSYVHSKNKKKKKKQQFVSLFCGLLNDETDLRVREDASMGGRIFYTTKKKRKKKEKKNLNLGCFGKKAFDL
jgi:hypothetical protein